MPYFGHFILHYIVQLFGAGYKCYARVFCIFLGFLVPAAAPRAIKNPLGYISQRALLSNSVELVSDRFYSSAAGASASSAAASTGASSAGASAVSATGAAASASATSEDFLSFLGIAFFGSSSSSTVSF